jgi:hypothetical protein
LSLDERIRGGAEAQRVLADPAIAKAFADTESAILDKWMACPIRDKEAQHELKLMHKLLGDVRANLEQAVTDGKLAAEELRISEQRQSPAQKLRSLFR